MTVYEPLDAYPMTFTADALERLQAILGAAYVELPMNRESDLFVEELMRRIHILLNPVVS